MQLDKTESFKLLKPVYAVNFLNDTFEKSPAMKDEYYHYYKIVNIKDTEKQIEGLEFLFIELPKFKPQNRVEKKLHELWLRFLTEINETTEEVPAELLENDDIRETVSYMERAAYTKAQLAVYDKLKIDTMTATSMLSASKEEGLKEGEVIGEQKKAVSIARNLLQKGMSIADVSDATGLSRQQIEEINL